MVPTSRYNRTSLLTLLFNLQLCIAKQQSEVALENGSTVNLIPIHVQLAHLFMLNLVQMTDYKL